MSRKHGGTSDRMFKKSVATLQSLSSNVVLTHRGERILEQAKKPYRKGMSKDMMKWIKLVNKAREKQRIRNEVLKTE